MPGIQLQNLKQIQSKEQFLRNISGSVGVISPRKLLVVKKKKTSFHKSKGNSWQHCWSNFTVKDNPQESIGVGKRKQVFI